MTLERAKDSIATADSAEKVNYLNLKELTLNNLHFFNSSSSLIAFYE